MQQTEKYQLKLIEGSDPFLPEALNDNARKLEGALAAHEAAVEQRLESRAGLVCGSYVGTGEYGAGRYVTIDVPGAERPPRLVLVSGGGAHQALLIRGMTGVCTHYSSSTGAYCIAATWTDTGVKWCSTQGDNVCLNQKGQTYHYAVFI